MNKKIIISVLFCMCLVSVVPVYAQTEGQTGTQNKAGFLSEIKSFINNMFQKNSGSLRNIQHTVSGETTPMPTDAVLSGNPSVSRMPELPAPCGLPVGGKVEELRLQLLVKQGKITAAQKTAIMEELTKVQDELKAWAKSHNIDERYVLGGVGMGLGQPVQSNGYQKKIEITGFQKMPKVQVTQTQSVPGHTNYQRGGGGLNNPQTDRK